MRTHIQVQMANCVVHNGIIENYMPLKEELLAKGVEFTSETDTEVVAHLLSDMYDGNFESTVRRMLERIEGSYSLVMICADEPNKIIATKKDNPLVVGLGKGEKLHRFRYPSYYSTHS